MADVRGQVQQERKAVCAERDTISARLNDSLQELQVCRLQVIELYYEELCLLSLPGHL